MPTTAPILDTERLRLRPHRAEDFADVAATWADPVVVRHITGRPSTPEESWARLLRYAGLWPLLGFGYWAVEERATGRYAGEVGFADFRREMVPALEGAPEAGWVLASWAHGQGFATEAVRAALSWGDAHLPSRRTVCIIDADHAASVRVAGKCGYVEYARGTYKESAIVFFER
ncbi:MAG: GNAT family N-acetyltransferase [Polyangiaceae bacterium]